MIGSEQSARYLLELLEAAGRHNGFHMAHEIGPVLEPILTGQRELGVSQNHVVGLGRIGQTRDDRAKAPNGGAISSAEIAQQFFSLFAELLKRWTGGQTRCGIRHDYLLSVCPRPHSGLKED